MKKLHFVIALAFSCIPITGFSQTAWTDGGADGIWSTVANWTSGVPFPASAVQFNATSFPDPDPATHVVGVDTGSTIVGSMTVEAGTLYSVSLVAIGPSTLQVNGALSNQSSNVLNIGLEYTFGSNTLNGQITFSSLVNTTTQNVSVSDAVSFTNNLYFTLTSNSSYGRYNLNAGASINLTGASLKIDPSSTYTGVNNDVFQLIDKSSGSWSGVTGSTLDVSSLPTLTGGLSWNTSSFTSNGSISVVPEPTTWALLAGSLTTVMIFRRRRQS